MNKKITPIIVLILSITSLYAVDTISAVDFNKYPLKQDLTAKSRGGTLYDKQAATDGLGAVIMVPIDKNKDNIKNDAYNKVIYNNLNKLDYNNTINDLIEEGKISISPEDLAKINNKEIVQEYTPLNVDNIENKQIYNACYWNTDYKDGTFQLYASGAGLLSSGPNYFEYDLINPINVKNVILTQTSNSNSQVKKIDLEYYDGSEWKVVATWDNLPEYVSSTLATNSIITSNKWRVALLESYYNSATSCGEGQFGVTVELSND